MLNNERGLTLIEVLAAMAILSIIVVAFVNISGYMTLAFSKSETEAIRLAERILNEERSEIEALKPAIDTQSEYRSDVDGYEVTINETELINNPPYPLSIPMTASNHVSIQGMVILRDTANSVDVTRLLTITVSWGNTP